MRTYETVPKYGIKQLPFDLSPLGFPSRLEVDFTTFIEVDLAIPPLMPTWASQADLKYFKSTWVSQADLRLSSVRLLKLSKRLCSFVRFGMPYICNSTCLFHQNRQSTVSAAQPGPSGYQGYHSVLAAGNNWGGGIRSSENSFSIKIAQASMTGSSAWPNFRHTEPMSSTSYGSWRESLEMGMYWWPQMDWKYEILLELVVS